MSINEFIKSYQGESAYLHEDDAILFAQEYAKEQIKNDRERIKYAITSDENKWWIESLIDDVKIELT